MAFTSSGLVSKVTTFAGLPASVTDWTAVRAIGAARVITRSMLGSCLSLAAMVERTEGMLVVAVVGVRPAAGDRLGAGVEADALRPVDVGVAEQRVLPAAEGIEGH